MSQIFSADYKTYTFNLSDFVYFGNHKHGWLNGALVATIARYIKSDLMSSWMNRTENKPDGPDHGFGICDLWTYPTHGHGYLGIKKFKKKAETKKKKNLTVSTLWSLSFIKFFHLHTTPWTDILILQKSLLFLPRP